MGDLAHNRGELVTSERLHTEAVARCGEALGGKFIAELLALVDTTPDPTAAAAAERTRLLGQITNLVESVAKGMPADERSDLFSLGIIAYQMLSGVVPYKADSALASDACVRL